MATYIVRQYFVVEIEVEADSKHEAMELAGTGESEYNITTEYVHGAGGPSIDSTWIGCEDEEVYEIDSELTLLRKNNTRRILLTFY